MSACPFSKKESLRCRRKEKREMGQCDQCHFLHYYSDQGGDLGILRIRLLGCLKQAGVHVGVLLDVYP
jgi:hypothetical protein